jgi:indole-3-glycerol phosphate synthase/phosphoribosylanthranilate isomerase
MLSVLDDAEARAVMAEAERLGMDVLVEVHDEAELARAFGLGATLVGINNRHLKTLKTDLAVTERLAAKVPADVLLVSESGVATRSDAERLSAHADAFLVGSSLMAAGRRARSGARSGVRKVKVCGLTRVQDMTAAAEAGATHAGLIMVPGTPRALTLGTGAGRSPRQRGRRAGSRSACSAMPPSWQVTGGGGERSASTPSSFMGASRPKPCPTFAAIMRVRSGRRASRKRGGDRLLFDSAGGGTGADVRLDRGRCASRKGQRLPRGRDRARQRAGRASHRRLRH